VRFPRPEEIARRDQCSESGPRELRPKSASRLEAEPPSANLSFDLLSGTRPRVATAHGMLRSSGLSRGDGPAAHGQLAVKNQSKPSYRGPAARSQQFVTSRRIIFQWVPSVWSHFVEQLIERKAPIRARDDNASVLGGIYVHATTLRKPRSRCDIAWNSHAKAVSPSGNLDLDSHLEP
jgi:hypothetical protein